MSSMGFPQIYTKWLNEDGTVNQAWFQLLITLWNRTGGAQGGVSDGQLTEGQFTSQIEYLEERVDEIEPHVEAPVDYGQLIQDAALAMPSTVSASSIQGLDGGAGLVTSVTGTANQVTASPTTGDVVLTTPQDIATGSTPQFARMGLSEAAPANALLGLAAGTTSIAPLLFTAGANLTSAVSGAAEYDGNRYWLTLASTSRAIVRRTLFSQTANVTVANTTTETTLISSGIGTDTLPANYGVIGKAIAIEAWGFHSAIANPTVRVRAYKGSTLILDTTALASGNSTNALIRIDAVMRWDSTTTIWAQGFYKEEGGGASSSDFPMVNTAAVTVNTNSEALKVTFTWGTADPGNTITITNLNIYEVS